MKKILFILTVAVSLASCEKFLMPDPVGKTPTNVFDVLWETLDEGYVHFSYNGVNWDSIHDEFQKKIIDTMSERQLYDTCVSMLKLLKDPAIVLKTPFAEYSYTDTAVFKPNFNRYLLERNYWKNFEKTGPFIHTVLDSVGYVYYESFEEPVTDAQLDIIIESLRLENDSIEGVVFDIRDNKGGDIANAFTLLKRMGVDTTFQLSAVLYKAFYKSGPEHGDVTDAQTAYIEQSDKTKFPKQFVLLTNRRTSNEAALFAAAATGYKNVTTMGDKTGRATGRIVGGELTNGWRVEYPASYYTTDDGFLIEEGVDPQKRVDMSASDEAVGKDSILEEALKMIKE